MRGKVGTWVNSQWKYQATPGQFSVAINNEPLPRLDKVLWAAFFKPIKEGDRRFIRLTPEVYFWDAPEDSAAPSPGWEEIEPHRIPAAELPLPQRNRAAYSAIEEWFKLRGYILEDHIQREDRSQTRRPSDSAPVNKTALSSPSVMEPKGIDALRHLVSSIPEHERKNYSISLDLLAALVF